MKGDLLEKLAAPFPEEAESTDPARGFTGIKMPYVIERLNDVFGLCGQGWKFEVTRMDIDKERVIAYVSLRYNIDGEWSKPIPASGDMNIIRDRVGDAIKGAVSDAVKKAASYLGVGMDAYKGKLGKGNAKPKRKARRATTPKRASPPTETSDASQPEDISWTTFWGSVKGYGLTQEEGRALLKTDSVKVWLTEGEGRTLIKALHFIEEIVVKEQVPF